MGWDQNTNTVLLTSDGSTPAPAPTPTPTPTPTPAPSVRFYPNSVVPMLENVTGVAYDSYSKDGVSVMYIYPLTSLPSDSGFFDTYDALLTQHGFVMIGDSNSDDLIYRNASQKQGLVISIMAETGTPPALVVFVAHDA